jgi:hypothetical protein
MKSAQTLSDIGRDTTVAEIMKPARAAGPTRLNDQHRRKT